VVWIFFSRCLDPVLDGGVGDEDAVVTPEEPAGVAVGQAIFGDQTDGPLLDAAGVLTVGQSQVGDITGEAIAAAEATMTRESDQQIDGTVGAGITKVVQGTGAHAVAPGAMATALAGARPPGATVPFDVRLGQVFDARDAFGSIRNILPWTSHRLLS
jgi:hypothetical protein